MPFGVDGASFSFSERRYKLMDQDSSVNKAVNLEHRLTNIENAAVQAAQGVAKLVTHVEKQNGRIGALEVWKIQRDALMAVLIAAGPFVFYALNRWV